MIARSMAEPAVVVLVDRWLEVSETFVAAEVHGLRAAGLAVRVEALAHAAHPAAGAEPAAAWEDEGTAQRAGAALWLAARHPLRCLGDLAARRRWRRDEAVPPLRHLAPAARRMAARGDAHLHVHFAAGAALAAMRLARLLGRSWSVTAHAYDIYQRPANLAEKLRAADFATSGCAYTVATLRELGDPVHEIVMGIDPAAWTPPQRRNAGRHVVAVGRLVEKKGFAVLIEAAALLRDRGEPLDRLTIVGEGPERAGLEVSVRKRGLGATVELAGAREHGELPALLAGADLLAMPSVVADDGDRDSMPVVVKEAMAMELPVVASDEVGLPELVLPGTGVLVPPGDAAALGDGLARVLALDAAERALMGRAGRARVLERADVYRESARLAALIRQAAAPAG